MEKLKKLKWPILISLVLAGLAFVIFAVFFNHVKIKITAEAPFTIEVFNLKIFNCEQNDCQVTLAPGSYKITLNKPDYQSIADQLDLKLGQDFQKSYQFELTPKIQPIGDWNSGQNFNQMPYLLENLKRLDLTQPASIWPLLDNGLDSFSTVENFQIASNGKNFLVDNSKKIILMETLQSTPEVTPIPSGQDYFYSPDNSKVIYVANDQETFQQTLYSLSLGTRPLTPQVITTFLRKISAYKLVANRAFTHLALLDQSDADKVGLYIIDLANKSRKLIHSEANLIDFIWLENDFLNATPNTKSPTQYFLIQKRNPVTFKTELYRGSLEQPALELLTISKDLHQLLIINNHQLIYTAPYSVNGDGIASGFNFQKIDLETGNVELIFSADDLSEPTKIQYDYAQKRLLFLSGNTIYGLSLTL